MRGEIPPAGSKAVASLRASSVSDFRERMLLRKAVEISVDTVYVCTQEEWDSAQKLGREPLCVGFNKAWVKPCHGNNDSHQKWCSCVK
jgi:hypothetical protein